MAFGKKKTTEEAPKAQELELKKEEEARNSLVKNKKTIKDLIAPSGIDASNKDHLEIISNVKNKFNTKC